MDIFLLQKIILQSQTGFFGIDEIVKLNKKIYIIQLENYIKNLTSFLKIFVKFLKIKFSNKLKKFNFHNLKWWGDKIREKINQV